MNQINISKNDLGLIGRAARERWPIPPKTKTKVLAVLHEILEDENSKTEEKIKATNALAGLDRLNLKHEELYTPKLNITVDLENMSEEELFARKQQLETFLFEQRTLQLLTTVTADEAFEPLPDAVKELTAEEYEVSEWKVKKTRTTPTRQTGHHANDPNLAKARKNYGKANLR